MFLCRLRPRRGRRGSHGDSTSLWNSLAKPPGCSGGSPRSSSLQHTEWRSPVDAPCCQRRMSSSSANRRGLATRSTASGSPPAVTTPTLRQAAGDGRTREILLGGDLFMGTEARRQGIASHVVSEDDVLTAATAWARDAAGRPAGAMRTTKQWLSELDGSSDDAIFDGPVAGSAPLAGGREAVRMLEAFWNSKRSS